MSARSLHHKEVLKYCADITKGIIPAGTYARKAVSRFLDDVKRVKENTFEYVLCPDIADEVIDFAEALSIPDIQTEDKKLSLLPWMKFLYYNIWGFRYKTDKDKRRFRSGYIEVARKNSKTTSILFPFILYDFLTTDAAESYFVSKDDKQSVKAYKEILGIIKSDDFLSAEIAETVTAITLKNSRISFFSSESKGIDSYKNSLSIIDEFHAYDNDKIVTAFRYGGRARKNNLTLIITSAGLDISLPCYAENEKCKKVLNKMFTDETYFGIIYAYDEADDWKNPKNFIKANPSLNTFLSAKTLKQDLDDALMTPSHQPDFKSKTCGIWTNEKSSWIPLLVWEQNKKKDIDISRIDGAEAYGALDLSSVSDFTSFTLFFRYEENIYYAKHFFYIPEETVQERYRKENINILEWVQNGIVTAIPGASIDYQYIVRDIKASCTKYRVQELAYDPHLADFITSLLEKELPDLVTIPYPQGLQSMSQPTKQYEKAVLDHEIVDTNPVMTWMISNVQIRPDVNNNYKPLKDYKASTKRIDGVITSIMAFDRLKQNTSKVVKEKNLDIFWG